MNDKRLAIALTSLALILGGCRGKGHGDSSSSAPSGACTFKSISGFCFSTPSANTPVETANTVTFHRLGGPKPAQEIIVVTEKVALDSPIVRKKRDFARKGSGGAITVLEDIDLLGGKGFYVATQTPTNVVVNAVAPGPGGKLFSCSFSAHTKDKDALSAEIQACKSIRAAE